MSFIKLRHATPEDIKKIFEWRNAEEIRQFSFNTALIPWKTHVEWFNTTLLCNDRILMIGEIEENPIGVIQYNLLNSEEAIINIYLVPGLQSQGLGTKLLLAGIKWASQNINIKHILAEIIPDNIASIKAFTKAGFQETHRVFKINTQKGCSNGNN